MHHIGTFFAFWVTLLSYVIALRVEIPAASKPEPLCIRDFVGEGQMVVINIKSNGHSGDGQILDLLVKDSQGNVYFRKKDISGDNSGGIKLAFTIQQSSSFDVCFTNQLEHKWTRHEKFREIELDIESGALARNWNAIQASEKLQPAELDLRKVEQLTEEIVDELKYLKRREERMRDTNESTNSRVKWFSILVISSLVGFGAWQVQYLRHYFRVKHII